MSPVRLSTGRTVSPLKQPRLHGVKKLEIPKTPIVPLVPTKLISLHAESRIKEFDAQLSDSMILELPIGELSRIGFSSFPAMLDQPDYPDIDFQPIEPVTQKGKSYTEKSILSPWDPLPRAYNVTYSEGRAVIDSEQDNFEMIRPLLMPSLISDHLQSFSVENTLRPSQIEGVQALIAEPSLMLADDLGTGRRVIASQAMQYLIQNRLVRRALLVVPETALRLWSHHLSKWTPALAVTTAHGEPWRRNLDWNSRAHVLLVDYDTLTNDVEGGIIQIDRDQFDLVIMDAVEATRRAGIELWESIYQFNSERRWVLGSGLPSEAVDWVTTFRFLTPELVEDAKNMSAAELRQRFRTRVLHRSKEDLLDDLPRISREEIWVDLDEIQQRAYEDALAEERYRLKSLGASVTRTHVHAAIERLKGLGNFHPDSLDGAKVRALVDLIEGIVGSKAKVVVFSQYQVGAIDRLQQVLEPYGASILRTEDSLEKRAQALREFRSEASQHVLLAEHEARSDGKPLVEATYVIHFDHSWNPAVRKRSEQRIHPMLGPHPLINIYELWLVDTIEEQIHAHLRERNLLPGDLAQDTRPADVEESIAMDEWLKHVLDIEAKAKTGRRTGRLRPDTGLLPSTSFLRDQLERLSPEQDEDALRSIAEALGFMQTDGIDGPSEGGCTLVAWREDEMGTDERILLRLVRSDKNVGVKEGRKLLIDLDEYESCAGAYMVAVTDFTSACKKLADESKGKLALISGDEFLRHLHIIGWSP